MIKAGIIHKRHIDVYDCPLFITFKEEAYHRFLDRDIDTSMTDSLGLTTFVGKGVVIFVDAYQSTPSFFNTMAHEAFHGADMIMISAGVNMVEHSGNEAHAYLVGYITELIYTAYTQEQAYLEKIEGEKDGV